MKQRDFGFSSAVAAGAPVVVIVGSVTETTSSVGASSVVAAEEANGSVGSAGAEVASARPPKGSSFAQDGNVCLCMVRWVVVRFITLQIWTEFWQRASKHNRAAQTQTKGRGVDAVPLPRRDSPPIGQMDSP